MKASRKIATGIVGLIVTAYALNAAVIFFTQPVSVQNGAETHEHSKIGFNEVISIEGLRSGGIGLWSKASLGYVNVLSEEQIIYVNGDYADDENPLGQTEYLYRHEYAHILQKRLIAERSGGYPSYLNPIASSVYYFNLLQLNGELAALMPPVREDEGWIPFPGLEAAADCYAQPYSSPEEQAYFQAPYLYPGHCDAEQEKIARGLLSGRWPQPLTEEERITLISTNLTNDPPPSKLKSTLKGLTKTLNEYLEKLPATKKSLPRTK